MDVVYNHTAEGNHLGPTISFKGIDNRSYYRLVDDNPRFYMDYTGTGQHTQRHQPARPPAHHGFPALLGAGNARGRFPLRPRLDFGTRSARREHVLGVLRCDSPGPGAEHGQAHRGAVGRGRWRLSGGQLPGALGEWNGKYRDAIRRYWKGDEGLIGELAYRLTGSPDLYQHGGKQPYASINFITAHDGFTLNDLVSYNDKHNDANGENNKDGDNNNASWNCGAEGVTDDEEVNTLRRRQRRNFLATMFLSQGVPMICGGDEYGRTQDGNNNAYCQDNEISWLDWQADKLDAKLFEYTCKLIDLRPESPRFPAAEVLPRP